MSVRTQKTMHFHARLIILVCFLINVKDFFNKKGRVKTIFPHSPNYLYSGNDNISNTPIILTKCIITYITPNRKHCFYFHTKYRIISPFSGVSSTTSCLAFRQPQPIIRAHPQSRPSPPMRYRSGRPGLIR